MAALLSKFRLAIGVAILLCIVAIAAPSSAQQRQPLTVNPTADSVKEEQLLQQLRQVQGRISIPDARESVLIQPAGRNWQQFHEVTLRWIGAIAILGMLVLLVGFYIWRGTVRVQSGRSGRTITRFNGFERFIHWLLATCFIVLAITGLNITFGKPLLLPLMSPEAFTAWSEAAKYAHNFLSFPFTIAVILMFLMWIGDNIPNKVDVDWIKAGGGLTDPKKHPPAHRFNAGQKMMYWIVVLGGTAVAITGYLLMFPFYGTGIEGMQLAQIIHSIVAVLYVAAILGHIYLGTIGMEGAFESMSSGEVDVNWAKEHHSLWQQDEMGKSRVGGTTPRGAPAE